MYSNKGKKTLSLKLDHHK